VLIPNKAYTSAVLRMPSGDNARLAKPDTPLYSVNTTDPRVVLFAGGYCASPIGGMGTVLALCGAYVLAGELSRHAEL